MNDTERLAAEYAVGLLQGEDLLRARGMLAAEPEFAQQVRRWEDHLAPLLDEVAPATPRSDLWQLIETRLEREAEQGTGGSSNVIALQRKLARWRWAAAISSAAAAIAIAFVGITSLPSRADMQGGQTPIAQAPLVSSIPVGDTGLRLEVTYLMEQSQLIVSATGLAGDGVHDHELWVVPAQGTAQSLGVVAPGTIRKSALDATLAAQLRDGARLVLTREPLGGAVPGSEAGPVVASGQLSAI